jgi:hypothetical protein
MFKSNVYRVAVLVGVCLILSYRVTASQALVLEEITTPLAEFGFNIGDDYQLANYTQLGNYWTKLASESDRMTLEVIGDTAEGRPIYMAIITSPENHQNLDEYKSISSRLALAEGLDEEDARGLAAMGRSVVWIDGGLHADESLGAQQLIEMVYQMVSSNDDETLRFLEDTILLATCVNPDGLELVADWYMSEPDPLLRSLDNLPRLYQKYAGHDNNRDFYMSSQPETEAINRVLYREWFPQIVYNHHQTGPSGTVLFAPPFRDPFNYNFDPLIVTSLDLVAGAMHTRFLQENKPGATMRSGATYSTWWNGGLRTGPYFHNMIGLLTETIGSPTPIEIPFELDLQVPRGDYPRPVEPGPWHFAQSVAYSITANRAVLDVASRYRDTLLFNIWRMGANSIARGRTDTWTITPDRVEEVRSLRAEADEAFQQLRQPEQRDPRGYVIPSDQPDFLTATKFVNALIKNGIAVGRALEDFDVDGSRYPAGSYVVTAAQAFRPHIMDMFEPQDYPDDFAYPGASPTPPYDTAGWTLAYQMGVKFDRILDAFDGPFERIENFADVPPGQVSEVLVPEGYLLGPATNDAFIAFNRLAGSEDVYRLTEAVEMNGRTWPAGTSYFRAGPDTLPRIEELALEQGLRFQATSTEPESDAFKLEPVRIGLWDRYGGSESSGWARFVLESFEFPFQIVYPQALNAGELASRFDVLIFVDGGIPERERTGEASGEAADNADNVPANYQDQLGDVSISETVPQLREFMESGGTVVAIGGSTALARHLGLPVSNALAEVSANGTTRPLRREQFYVPGSILEVEVDTDNPVAFGLDSQAYVVFSSSPAFRLVDDDDADADPGVIREVARYAENPLRSGWAWGEDHLTDATAVIDADVGDGKLLLFGPEIIFRSQSHGTFKFLFNSIYYGSSEAVTLGQD